MGVTAGQRLRSMVNQIFCYLININNLLIGNIIKYVHLIFTYYVKDLQGNAKLLACRGIIVLIKIYK